MTEIGLFSFGETSEVRACALAPVVSYTGKPKKGDTLHAALLRVLPGEERKLVGLGEAALKPSPAAVLMFVPPGSLTENKYVLLSVIGLKDGTAIEHDKKAFGLSGGCPAFSKESLFSEEIS